MTSHDFLSFVRAVHWRMGVMRALEGLGMGVLAGGLLGIFVMGVTLWRGEMAGGVGLGVMGASGLIGATWGVMRPPNLLSAAMLADQQLALKDLLSTALAAQDRADPWAGAVVAMADHRCRSLQPRQVVLNRLGARAWGGIAVTALLCVSVAVMAPSATPSMASDSRLAFVSPDELDRLAARTDAAGQRSPAPPRPRSVEPDRPTGITAGVDDPAQGEQNGDAVDSPHRTEIANPEGAGGGKGQTQASADPDRLTVPPLGDAQAPVNGDAHTASGGAARDGSAGIQPPTGLHISAGSSAPVAPWDSDQWGISRSQAIDAIERNQIPGAYRDLVRAYFER